MKKSLILIVLSILVAMSAAIYIFLLTHSPAPVVVNISTQPDNLISQAQWLEQQKQKTDFVQSSQAVKLLVVGDIMLSRTVGRTMVQKNDYHYPFLNLQEIISTADIAFGNLESPIFAGPAVPTGSFVFRADPETAESLKWAGFDVLSLANNHILNMGQKGLLKTFELLTANNIQFCGAAANGEKLRNNFAIREVQGLKIGFLCYAYGPDSYSATAEAAGMAVMVKTNLLQDLATIKPQADFIVVSLHDGVEYAHKSSASQQEFAHLAIDSGADLFVGHHPHTVQEVEQYRGKYILYSLGNFVFDQMWSQDTKEGLAVQLSITKDGVQKIDYLPVIIEDYSQPRLANPSEKQKILQYISPIK